MSPILHRRGKKPQFLEDPSSHLQRIESRPGGWAVVEDASGERKRVALHSVDQEKSFFYHAGLVWSGQWDAGGQSAEESFSGLNVAEPELRAQFPGKVRKILVPTGQEVGAGTVLLLVEAMKMEFSICAPHEGSVKQFFVHEGDHVAVGAPFLEFAKPPQDL